MKIIEVNNCNSCPYCTGTDPSDCPFESEEFYCGYDRLVKDPNLKDKVIGCFDVFLPVDIPKWCQLKDATKTHELKGN